MTRDDIIRMAREVGAGEPESLYGRTDYFAMTEYELERFAALIAAAEREACARFVEEGYVRQFENPWREDLAAAIRARGEK